MELKQIYEQLNGDYNSVLQRLLSEDRIKKYLLKFMGKNMDTAIVNALEAKDYETAFREVHNLKGVCANLNLDQLFQSSSRLTESLRGGDPGKDITPLVEEMKSDYAMTMKALNNLKE